MKKTKCTVCNDTKIEILPKGQFSVADFCSNCQKSCHLCHGDGFIFEKDELGREHAQKCQCQDLAYRIMLFNNAQIPSQFYDATFENFEISGNPSLKTALATARFSFKNYQNGKWEGLLFMGGVGVGKTRLVSTMLRDYSLIYGIPCLFREFSSLLSEIKSGYDRGLSEMSVLQTINNIEILVIDELGKGRRSDWEINILDTIISNRYNMRKTTIFTTNYTDTKATSYGEVVRHKDGKGGLIETEKKETLEQRVYPRIYSRLKGMCDFILMKGPDFRDPRVEFST
ncbi:MAG: ATP-binding protein [Deltaproteobacteria bacterium]|jgi:DNA replication protein DnaC|nr:ATP-binding protein [Deltaproteobacteria bacterium]MBT4090142.1 ATP-binding protein [Deltaproteobacteria bacterium]MBT4263516.1 ATP-binding protein [Deltaproteobacteria bacterium]MBT4642393.1 ATP-binding protein [Deltaproteobacteria bacterium]MBT6502244.1 ATP-binding protein [Deltaproteobacteria bacterium]